MTGSTATIAEQHRPPANHAALRLGLYLLLGLALRLLLFAHFPALLTNDSPDYIKAAYAIYTRLDFANEWLGDVRMPGYPAFLAALYPLTGTRSDLLVGAQSALGLLCVPLGWQIGRLLHSQRIADGLAIFFALHPVYLLLEHALMTEALALFLMLVLTWGGLLWLQRPASVWGGLGVGALLGLGGLVRVNVLPFGAALLALPAAAWGINTLQKRQGLRVRALLTVLLPPLLGLTVILAPWFWRNYTLYATFSLSEHSNRSLLMWKTMSATMDPTLPLFQQYAQGYDTLDFAWLNDFSPLHSTVAAEAIAAELVREQVQAHPDRHLRAMLRSALNHTGIFIEGYVPRDDRAMIAWWFTALVPNPASVAGSVPAVDEWLTFIPVTQPSAWTAIWGASGTFFLQVLRPLLYLAFALASLRFGFLIGRQRLNWSAYPAIAITGLIAGCLATLLFHALTLTGSDRFSTLSDWAALAVILYIFPYVIQDTHGA